MESVGKGVESVKAGDHVIPCYQVCCVLSRYCYVTRRHIIGLLQQTELLMSHGCCELQEGARDIHAEAAASLAACA